MEKKHGSGSLRRPFDWLRFGLRGQPGSAPPVFAVTERAIRFFAITVGKSVDVRAAGAVLDNRRLCATLEVNREVSLSKKCDNRSLLWSPQ